MAINNKNGCPKYKYGLLESPDTSFFSHSSANELSTTVNQGESFVKSPLAGNLPRNGCSATRQRGEGSWQGPSPDTAVVDISGISSIAGEQRGKSTEKTSNADTLLATEEYSLSHPGYGGSRNRTIENNDSRHVFQLPTGRAPRKTPKFTPGRNSSHTTPRAFDYTSSGGSRSDTPATPSRTTKTPRSARSDVTDTPRVVESSNIVSIVEGRGLARFIVFL